MGSGVPDLPKLIVNASCFNTGREFRFTISEVGTPSLGYVPYAEVDRLLAMKRVVLEVKDATNPRDAVRVLLDSSCQEAELWLTPQFAVHLLFWLYVQAVDENGEALSAWLGAEAAQTLHSELGEARNVFHRELGRVGLEYSESTRRVIASLCEVHSVGELTGERPDWHLSGTPTRRS